MPNQISEDRRKVVYLEEKEVWEQLQVHADKTGLNPSILIRMATRQLVDKLNKPNAKLIFQIYDSNDNQ